MSSQLLYKTVGNTIAQWEENSPLTWTMEEPVRSNGMKPDPIRCDLSALRFSYSMGFLLALKEAFISSRNRKQLRSIATELSVLRLVLQRVYACGCDNKTLVTRIDGEFLTAAKAAANGISRGGLETLARFFRFHCNEELLFEKGLQPGDFPRSVTKRGARGTRIHNILAKALHRSALVHALGVAEAAFEEGTLDLGRYSFLRLALNIFCRSESYRRLTLEDLQIDKNTTTGAVNYFLRVLPAKSRIHNPSKISYSLHPEVGKLLEMQRHSVFERYGHLAPTGPDGPKIGRIALFPATALKSDRSAWINSYANQNIGMLSGGGYGQTYIRPLKSLTKVPIAINTLRHTIGTQLAQMGCSANTIQAVLKHASDTTCRAYVDIAFEGLIDKLSEGLEAPFEEHFPIIKDFVSASTSIPLERRIESEDMETARFETTGMCGRNLACSYAPLTCYACPRFIPCHDADHSINLDVVTREIKASEGRGRAMQHDVERWKSIRNHIRLVMTACDNKRRALEMGAA